MPEGSYDYRPVDGVRNFGEILAHTAGANYVFCAAAKGEKPPFAEDHFEKTAKTRAAIMKATADSIAYCDAAFTALTDASAAQQVAPPFGEGQTARAAVLISEIGHVNEHYGNLVTYFRINGISLMLPPLRERLSELRPLAEQFIAHAARAAGRKPPRLSREALDLMTSYSWPGNIRELRNMLARAVLLCTGDSILARYLPVEKMRATIAAPIAHAPRDAVIAGATPAGTFPPTVSSSEPEDLDFKREARALERQRIIEAMKRSAGNQSQAAKLLGMSRRTLLDRLDLYALPRPRKRKLRT
jgi:hypothetical protein